MWIRQGVTTFREFWARSTHFGQNGGWDESAEPEFFLCVSTRPIGNFATADFHQIWLRNVFRCPVEESGKTFSKIFTLGVICPQNLKWKVKQAPHSEQATGYGMHCREILFTPRSSTRAREFPRLVNFSVRIRCTVAELPGVKVAQFSDFGLFSPYKTLKTYLPVTSLQSSLCCHAVSVRLSVRLSVCYVRGSRQNE